MMTFEYQFDDDAPLITIEIPAGIPLPEVLDAFTTFLVAAGYGIDGEVDITPTLDDINNAFNDGTEGLN